jgi:hypothetical protein
MCAAVRTFKKDSGDLIVVYLLYKAARAAVWTGTILLQFKPRQATRSEQTKKSRLSQTGRSKPTTHTSVYVCLDMSVNREFGSRSGLAGRHAQTTRPFGLRWIFWPAYKYFIYSNIIYMKIKIKI